MSYLKQINIFVIGLLLGVAITVAFFYRVDLKNDVRVLNERVSRNDKDLYGLEIRMDNCNCPK